MQGTLRFFTIMNFSAGYMGTIMQLVSCTKKQKRFSFISFIIVMVPKGKIGRVSHEKKKKKSKIGINDA